MYRYFNRAFIHPVSPRLKLRFLPIKRQTNAGPHGLGSKKHDFHAVFRCQGAAFSARRFGCRADRHAGDSNIQATMATAPNSRRPRIAVSSAVQGADIRVILPSRIGRLSISSPNQHHSVQQLRGKKIGTGGVGSLAEILARRILIAHNVRPKKYPFCHGQAT